MTAPELTAEELDRVRALLDERAIHGVLLRYARGVDRGDEALIRSAYHDDGWDDHGVWSGLGSDFAAYIVPRVRGRWEGVQHAMCNTIVELDGAAAHVETYFVASHERHAEDGAHQVVQFGGRYLDRFERRDGEWRIAHRRVVHDWSSIQPSDEMYPERDEYPRGRIDGQDLLYELGVDRAEPR